MIREFEGKTRNEAIEKAIAELGLDRDELDVEILEEGKGLFKKGPVKIRICVDEEVDESEEKAEVATAEKIAPSSDSEGKIIEFLTTLLQKMDYPGEVFISSREEGKITLDITSEHSGILIGKKGKNLDAIQLLVNVFAGKLGLEDTKFIVDIENYREKREEALIAMAQKTAAYVRKSKNSKLLDLMNPYERRVVHTVINEYENLCTVSEGDGLYKQVRIFYKEEE